MKCYDENGKEIPTPRHLLDDAQPLICDHCGRRTRADEEHKICGMMQPSGTRCMGSLEKTPILGKG